MFAVVSVFVFISCFRGKTRTTRTKNDEEYGDEDDDDEKDDDVS